MRGLDRCAPFGAAWITKQLTRLRPHLEGALAGGDAEDIHQLRVTSRRIRAALPVFRGCLKGWKTWTPVVKELTRSLGAARDLDVQILFLESLRSEYRRRRMGDGIAFLLDLKREQRSSLQSEVAACLSSLTNSGLLAEIEREGDRHPQSTQPVSLFFLAHRHITAAYEGLLKKSHCLQQESAAAEHHEMRIAAKRLRYTLELFAAPFDGKLAAQISFLKKLQDVLGEMHDSDVWLSELPSAKEQAQEQNQVPVLRGLVMFQAHISNCRHRLHQEAAALWEGAGDSLKALDRFLESEVILPATGRIALLSDIHGNFHALQAVLRDARERGARVFLNAGDSVGYGALPGEVVEEIAGDGFISVQGNFDKAVLRKPIPGHGRTAEREKRRSVLQTAKALSRGSRRFLAALPKRFRLGIGGRTILIEHSSPLWKKEHLTPDTPEAHLLEIAGQAKADLLLMGHSHQQFLKQVGGCLLLNPGSVGRPADGNPMAAYALCDPARWTFEFFRIPYDVEAAAGAIRKAKLPEHFAQMIFRGRSLESVIEEELSRSMDPRIEEVKDQERAMVEAMGLDLSPDPAHAEKVRSLSLSLFDLLQRMHGLGPQERSLLEYAAFLHDVGWSRGRERHHLDSMELILNDQTLSLNTRERCLVASIARYHNSLPKAKHSTFSVLSGPDRRIVIRLSAMLRLADALDASHRGGVQLLSVLDLIDKVILKGTFIRSFEAERSKFATKKDLFEIAFRRQIELEFQEISPAT